MMIRISQLLPLSTILGHPQHFLQHGEQQQIVSTHFALHEEQPLPILNDYLKK